MLPRLSGQNPIRKPETAHLRDPAPAQQPPGGKPGRPDPNLHPGLLPQKPEQARIAVPGRPGETSPGGRIGPDPRPETPPIDGSNRPSRLPVPSYDEQPGRPGFSTFTEARPPEIPVWTGYHHATPMQWETLKQTDESHQRFVGENRYGYIDHSHVQTHDPRTGKALPQPKRGLGPSETGNVYRVFRPDQALSETNPLDPLYAGGRTKHPITGAPLGPGKNDGLRGSMALNMQSSHIASTGHVHPSAPKGFPYMPSRADMMGMAGAHPVNSEGRPIDHIIAAPRPPKKDQRGPDTHGDLPVGIIYNNQSYKTLLPPHPDAPERPDFGRFTHPLGTDHPPGPPGPPNFSGNATGFSYPPGKDYPMDLEF